MLIETLFLRLFEPDQSEIKEIVQEIVNIHNGAIVKNGTTVSEFTIILPYSSFITLTCCSSFPALFLCLANLHYSFLPSFVSNLAYKLSYARPFAMATAFFALLFTDVCKHLSNLFLDWQLTRKYMTNKVYP